MVSVSVKLKKADASTYVEHFDTPPTWEVLTSRISERFNIPSSNVVVGYVDDALDTVTLTNDQGLLGYYNSLGQSPKIKFVVLDRHTPDVRTSIMASWPSDFDIYGLSKSVKLFCWVLTTSDTESTEPFSVDIEKEKTVDDLKAKMKKLQERTFGGVDTSTFRVWKLSPPTPSVDAVTLKFVKSPAEIPGCIKLNPVDSIEMHFPSPPLAHIHIIVQLPPRSRKRSRSSEDAQASKKTRSDGGTRKWSVNGAISGLFKDQVYFLDPADQKLNDIMNGVTAGDFSLIMGPRSSGKSTRLFRLRELLEQKGYCCLYFTFERVNYLQDTEIFWSSVGGALHYASRKSFSLRLSSSANFIDAFMESNWNESIVLLIDELSEMLLAPDVIRDSFLRALRTIRHSNRESAIKSVIAAGTFSTMRLTTSRSNLSPFNIQNSFQIPYFSKDETTKIFDMFAEDNYITIDEAVIDDIWAQSNGHPGMTCICGKVVSDNLKTLLDHRSKTITYANWQKFPVSKLHNEILAYNTFRSMVNYLKDPIAQAAVRLFRTAFAGFLGEVEVTDRDEDLADLLTSEGVLSRPNRAHLKYHVTSPLIDSLIRLKVIPDQFPGAPSIPPLQLPPDMLIPRILEECLKCFDKELMREACWRSSKVSKVPVNGSSNVPVPRESVYDTELMRILCNWLKLYGWSVTGQWHLKTPEGRHRYSDIIVGKPHDATRIVFKLLATGDKKIVQDHITKTPEYMSLVSAHEGWVIHFTCEDPYTPIWQSSAQLTGGVNVIHLVHDVDFTQMVMHICWRNQTGNTVIESHRVSL